MDELRQLMTNDPFDVIAVGETHCDSTIPNSDLFLNNFTVIRKDRSRHGGGVALYVRNTISFTHLTHLNNDLETVWIKIKQKKATSLFLGVIYRPPNSSNDFFEKLSEMIQTISESSGDIVIVGDFNCDLIPENHNALSRTLSFSMDSNLLHQPTVPTRVTPHSKSLIDHVFTSVPDDHPMTGVVKTHISDHYLIFTVLGQFNGNKNKFDNVIEYRCYSNFSLENFISTLENMAFDSILNENDVNQAWQMWYDLYMRAVNEHAPIKKKRIRSKLCPWVNGELIEAMNKRDWYHKMATKHDNPESKEYWLKYKLLRNEITGMIRKAKNDYICTLLQEHGGTPTAMWKTLKLISSSKQNDHITLEVDGEEVTESQTIAQHLNNYFINSVDKYYDVKSI